MFKLHGLEFQVRIEGLTLGVLEPAPVNRANASFSPDEPDISISNVDFGQNVTTSKFITVTTSKPPPKETCPCPMWNETCWFVYNNIYGHRVARCWFDRGDDLFIVILTTELI